MIRALANRLRRRLPRDGAGEPQTVARRWLPWPHRSGTALPRRLCRYRLVPLPDVPPRHQVAALQTQLIAWSPFPAASYLVAFHRQHAVVFARPTGDAALAPTSGTQPEPLFQPPPAADGLRLVACSEGVDGQYWQDGLLRASRWWPQAPTTAEWQNFQRGARVADDHRQASPPAIVNLPRTRRPWLRLTELADLTSAPRRREQALLAIGSFLMLLPTAWFGMEWLTLAERQQQLDGEVARLQQTAGPGDLAREEALNNAAIIAALRQTVAGAPVLPALAHLAQQLPADGSIVRELEIRDNTVRVALTPSERTGRTEYLKALEHGAWFRKVQEVRSPAAPLTLQAELGDGTPPLAEPPPTPNAATPGAAFPAAKPAGARRG